MRTVVVTYVDGQYSESGLSDDDIYEFMNNLELDNVVSVQIVNG